MDCILALLVLFWLGRGKGDQARRGERGGITLRKPLQFNVLLGVPKG